MKSVFQFSSMFAFTMTRKLSRHNCMRSRHLRNSVFDLEKFKFRFLIFQNSKSAHSWFKKVRNSNHFYFWNNEAAIETQHVEISFTTEIKHCYDVPCKLILDNILLPASSLFNNRKRVTKLALYDSIHRMWMSFRP